MAKLISITMMWEIPDNMDDDEILDNLPEYEVMKGKANWFMADPNTLEIEDVKDGYLENYDRQGHKLVIQQGLTNARL